MAQFTQEQLEEYGKNAELTKQDLRTALAQPDKRIIQAAEALGELEELLNINAERLREWYCLYFPEASFKIKKHEIFAKILSKSAKRNDFKEELGKIAKTSIGAELGAYDLNTMQKFAHSIHEGYSVKTEIEEYLAKLMRQNYPNLKAVAGTLVGAKLISRVGSADRLAKLPSSTIQVLGAEKALFRHLKTGAKPPKYGIILQHQLLQNTRKNIRGKVARALASKISIAIKRDVFGGEFMGEELNQELDKKVERIKNK